MTTITKNIDVRIDDYEVELELDADDLEDFDSDDLWGALQSVASSREIADFVGDDSDVLEAILKDTDADTLRDYIDLDVLVGERLEAMTTDERKETCLRWLGESVEGNPLREFLREQVGVVETAPAAPLDALLASLRDPNGETVANVVAALVKHYGAALVIAHAVGELEASCRKAAQS